MSCSRATCGAGADGAHRPHPRPLRASRVRGCGDHNARTGHGHHHPSAAQPGGARETGRQPGCTQRRSSHLGCRGRLPRTGDVGDRRVAERAGQPHRRIPRRDERALERPRSRAPRPLLRFRRHRRAPATDTEGWAAHRHRRTVARRAGTCGVRAHGWYGFWLKPDATKTCLDDLRAAADRVERPAHLGPLEISITPQGLVSAESVAAYEALGVDRLVVYPVPIDNEDDVTAALEKQAALIVR